MTKENRLICEKAIRSVPDDCPIEDIIDALPYIISEAPTESWSYYRPQFLFRRKNGDTVTVSWIPFEGSKDHYIMTGYTVLIRKLQI